MIIAYRMVLAVQFRLGSASPEEMHRIRMCNFRKERNGDQSQKTETGVEEMIDGQRPVARLIVTFL
ncbi:hypothetical protein BDV26DRAFT_269657 [Aspergillus bertholletiae]|uniref:Uncharacterized protein n=1 Tax=Aspergillus bertholletiae TaxID=1226010 RepID=A0A5N7B0G6_9EURO|nr:hypothetical protein BDV26DRAFT_269657 [Aspergillus bertholletiae]